MTFKGPFLPDLFYVSNWNPPTQSQSVADIENLLHFSKILSFETNSY